MIDCYIGVANIIDGDICEVKIMWKELSLVVVLWVVAEGILKVLNPNVFTYPILE